MCARKRNQNSQNDNSELLLKLLNDNFFLFLIGIHRLSIIILIDNYCYNTLTSDLICQNNIINFDSREVTW